MLYIRCAETVEHDDDDDDETEQNSVTNFTTLFKVLPYIT